LQTRDYLYVGVKLIGVYFAVLGITVLTLTLLSFGVQFTQTMFGRDDVLYADHQSPFFILIETLQPIAYLVCAFILTRKTEWCLALIRSPATGT
jgi:hypothetical protein